MSFSNFVQCQLSASLVAADVSLTLQAPTAPYQLPPATGGVLVLADSVGRPSQVEILRYASRAGNVLSGLQRGQEGTVALDWPVGSFCYQALTAGEYAKVSALQAQTADFTAVLEGRYWLGTTLVVTLPDTTTPPVAGSAVRFAKARGVTPTIQVGAGAAVIQTAKGSAASVLFDLDAEIVFVFNGTDWEI